MKSPRRVAFDVLYKIETEESYSSIAVNKALKENNLNKLDSSFASAIIYGVLEKKITLDYVIRSFSSIRLKKIETKTLTILRMSVYQMLYMDKVPDNASVNEAVQLAKNLRLFKSSGFINGILRSISRAETKCDLSKIKDKTKISYNLEEIANDSTLKGIFAKEMLEKLKNENIDKETIEKAIEIGMNSLS